MKNIFSVFQRSLGRFPSRPFLTEKGSTLSYADMERRVTLRGEELRERGLHPHHRVLYKGYNSTAFVTEMLAVSACDATFIPISPELPEKTVQAIEELVRPLDVQKLPTGWSSAHDDDGLSTILFTSGTTGAPKGVLLSQQNVLANIAMIGERIPESVISHNDSSYAFLPWFHSYGLVCELLFLMSRGASITVPDTEVPRLFVEEIRRVHPTLLFTVPRFLEKLERVSQKYWYVPHTIKKRFTLGARLRYLSVGGAAVSPATLSHFRDAWNVPVFQGYGLTETGPMVSLQAPPLSRASTASDDKGCGRPLSGISVRTGTTGELELTSPSVCQGYLGPDNTVWRPPEKFLEGGWFRTGDVMGCQEGEYLTFQNRQSGLWKLPGGKFVDPVFLEKCLLEMDGVEQAAIIGNGRQHLKAVLYLPSPGQRDLPRVLRQAHEYLLGRGFQPYELPQQIIILEKPLSVQDGTLSIKQEPKRNVLQDRYYN